MIETTALHLLLLKSMQTALETMFFAAPDSMSMDPLRPSGELIAASLTFDGKPNGLFWLVVSDRLARTLAANFMGCDDDAQLLPASVADVIGELANIMCGAVLSGMESHVNFDLGMPRSIRIGAAEPGPDFNAGSGCVCRFEFPEGALVSFLALKDPA
jgi:chemotaxis protein CheY-P-specific phosphatase CheC